MRFGFFASAILSLVLAAPCPAADTPDYALSLAAELKPEQPLPFIGVAAEMDGWRAWMEERDRRYEDRFQSQEKAITKAEAAQADYNTLHNGLAREMKEQYAMMLPRSEFALSVKAMDERINSLNISRGESDGAKWALGLGIAGAGLLISITLVVLRLIPKSQTRETT